MHRTGERPSEQTWRWAESQTAKSSSEVHRLEGSEARVFRKTANPRDGQMELTRGNKTFLSHDDGETNKDRYQAGTEGWGRLSPEQEQKIKTVKDLHLVSWVLFLKTTIFDKS